MKKDKTYTQILISFYEKIMQVFITKLANVNDIFDRYYVLSYIKAVFSKTKASLGSRKNIRRKNMNI